MNHGPAPFPLVWTACRSGPSFILSLLPKSIPPPSPLRADSKQVRSDNRDANHAFVIESGVVITRLDVGGDSPAVYLFADALASKVSK